MVAVPSAIPDAMPLDDPMAAIAGDEELHTPPVLVLLSGEVVPRQMPRLPVIAPVDELTVMVLVM